MPSDPSCRGTLRRRDENGPAAEATGPFDGNPTPLQPRAEQTVSVTRRVTW